MNESKELLEATIKGLEEKLKSVTDDLNTKNKELIDVNKPEMTGEMYENIQGLIEEGISQFDWSDADNYEFTPELDYDNKVVIGDISINDTHYIIETIMNEIDRNYKIVATSLDKE